MKRSEKGFSIVELLLVIIIVAVIGLLGWLAWRLISKHSSSPTSSSTSSSATSAAAVAPNQWTGGAGTYDWGTAANWSKGAPTEGQDLTIDLAQVKQPADGTNFFFQNTLTVGIGKLTFTGSVPSANFGIKGNTLKIAGGIVMDATQTSSNNAVLQASIDTNVDFTADQMVSVSTKSGILSFGMVDPLTVDVGSHTISFTTSNSAAIQSNAALSGTGTINVNATSDGGLTLYTPSPAFSGQALVASGYAILGSNNALGTAAITVKGGATLALASATSTSYTLTNPIHLSGNGITNAVSGPSATAGALAACIITSEGCDALSSIVLAGQVTLDGNTELGGHPTSESGAKTTFTFQKPVAGNYTLASVPGTNTVIIK